jgi:predicted nucleic acid-binding protein
MPAPLTSEVAIVLFEEWLPPPSLIIVPSHQHRSILKELLSPLGTAANLTSDAHLAGLTIEHGARLYSTDKIWNICKNVRNSDSLISIT